MRRESSVFVRKSTDEVSAYLGSLRWQYLNLDPVFFLMNKAIHKVLECLKTAIENSK
jgi:hypothetical protein